MKDEHGWTPLMCAAAEGHAATVELLVGEGANTTVVDSRGRNAEVLASKFRHCDVMQYLEQVRIHPKIDESDDDIEIIDDERYCKECGISYKDRSHFTSIAHLMEISKPVEASGYGIPEWNIGYRMLQRTGWHEYRGLGKDGKGKRYPIRTAFKRDRKGLGLDKNIVMRVTHPDAHTDRPRYKASKYSAIKLREDEIRKDKKIATKFRQEFS
ncbi:hypothetical protein L596_002804 [Steinernema carpocapsae]|uniref:G-patch domain-containing protein n=1 Tax=Steinernema carpocapsae TaxID=34508 RepID=A0A4U8UQB1_STECR|nr:hypothetical protein L596_002804 [Steinernema carpocapsae]